MVKKSKAPLVMSILNILFVAGVAVGTLVLFLSWQEDLRFVGYLSLALFADLPFLIAFSILAYRKEGGFAVLLIVWSVLILPAHLLTLAAGRSIRSAQMEREELAKDHPIPKAQDLGLEPLPADEGWSDEVSYFRPVHGEDLFKYFGRAQALPAVTKEFERKRVLVDLYLDDATKKVHTFECVYVIEYGEKTGDRTYVKFYMLENGQRDYDSITNFARIGRSEDGKTYLQVVSEADLLMRLQDDIKTLYGAQIRKEYERLREEAARRKEERRGLLSDLGGIFGTLFMSDSGIRAGVNAFRGKPREEYSCTFTNSMGCEETVYTTDGVSFYRANGEYVGHSEDGGHTIIEE